MEIFDGVVDKVRSVKKLRESQKLNTVKPGNAKNKPNGKNDSSPDSPVVANKPSITQDNIDSATFLPVSAKRKSSTSIVRLGRYKFLTD